MKITYLGHSAFLIEENGCRIAVDPFINGNPTAAVKPGELIADYVLVSHAHGDHMGDAMEISKRCGATIISTFEIATWCNNNGGKAHPLHIGGSASFPFGRVKLTIAHHGSAMVDSDGSLRAIGTPCGFLITMGSKIVYHSGDTGLFLDMKLIGEMNSIDVALLPIGDNFTMGIDDAVKAVEFLDPKLSIPMHYDTFDMIKADPQEFVKKVETAGKKACVVSIGNSIEV